MSLRPERIADYLKKEISNIILQKVRDPRLKSIVINHISVTQDISIAKVFYSVYQDAVSYTHLTLPTTTPV